MSTKYKSINPGYPLRYPYNDWNSIADYFKADTEEQTLADVFNAFYGIENRTNNINPLEHTPYVTLTDVRRLVTYVISERIHESPAYGPVVLANRIGADVSYFSKFKRSGAIPNPFHYETMEDGTEKIYVNDNIRPFAFTFQRLPTLCAYMFGSTCHNLMFGEEGTLLLPKVLRMVYSKLNKMSDGKIHTLISKGLEFRDKAIDEFLAEAETKPNCEGNPDYGQYRSEHEIIRERLREIATETKSLDYATYTFFTEPNSPIPFRTAWVASYQGELSCYKTKGREIDTASNQYVPNMEMVMFWVLATKIAKDIPEKTLDYFIYNDYIQVPGGASQKVITGDRPSICTYGKNKEIIHIQETDYLRILSFCAALPPKYKNILIGEILAYGGI